MAFIVLITPTPPDISAFGIRSISAYLKSKGHRTRLIFLPGSAGLLDESGDYIYQYAPPIMDQVTELCRGADLVGVSFMTYYFDRAVQITRSIKDRLPVPVIWGGIHSMCKPLEALEHADYVCMGEGEEALDELLDKIVRNETATAIPGIWCRQDGNTIENGIRPLMADLNALPFFDFSCEDHHVFAPEHGRIVPLDAAMLEKCLPLMQYFGDTTRRTYRTMTDRGCPHQCHYCNVPALKKLHGADKIPYFRHRSVEHVIAELEWVKARYPFIQAVMLFDDTFFSRSLKWMSAFAEAYQARIGLPFYCQASPTTLTREKLEVLIQAGLVFVEMGIQTGSPRIRELYNRKESNARILEAARLIHAYLPRLLPPDYHVIIDNPWETEEDLFATVDLLFKIPKPFGLAIASLIFFPETELYKRALAQGLIHDETTEIYRKPFYVAPRKSYAHFLIYLCTFQHIPAPIRRALISPRMKAFGIRHDLTAVYKLGYVLGEALRLAAKGLRSAVRGDFARIGRWFRMQLHHDPVVGGKKR